MSVVGRVFIDIRSTRFVSNEGFSAAGVQFSPIGLDRTKTPQGLHSHILLTGGGGLRGLFWGLKFWLKRDVWGYMRRGDFLGREEIRHKRNLPLVWDILGMLKTVGFLGGRQILKLGFFGV